jgi:hypothetical protein
MNQPTQEPQRSNVGKPVREIVFKTDAETQRKIAECHAELRRKHNERKQAQIRARIQIERDRYERTFAPVIVEQPIPTGNALQDAYNQIDAERRARIQRQRNAQDRYLYEHGYPI